MGFLRAEEMVSLREVPAGRLDDMKAETERM